MLSQLESLAKLYILLGARKRALVCLGLFILLPTNPVSAQDVNMPGSVDAGLMIPVEGETVVPLAGLVVHEDHNISGPGCDPGLLVSDSSASMMGSLGAGGGLLPLEGSLGYDGLFAGNPFVVQQTPVPVYVHPRQTVRHSKRHAEIWIRLPKNSRSRVSVNFVEYPPTTDFRIFKTSLPTQEATRFYLEASEWRDNQWHALVGGPQLVSHPEDANLKYIDLRPGDKRFVSFAPEQAAAHQGATDSELKTLTDAIKQLQNEVRTKTKVPDQVAKRLTALESQVRKAGSETAELKAYFEATANSEQVTRRFLFGEGQTNLGGHRVTKDGKFTSVDWTAFPQQISLSAPHSLHALPARPFTATVTFYIVNAEGNDPHRLPPISVTFGDSGSSAMGQISFRQQVAQPLSDLLVERGADVGTLHLAAIIEYKLDLGELGSMNIKGNAGNQIEVKLAE